MADDLGLEFKPGDQHYRAYVGPPEDYDLVAAMSFGLLTSLGLRQHNTLLDIGCGSLRVGRLLIPYLNSERYFGIEPNRWLVEEGIEKEVGQSLVQIKQPTFHFSNSVQGLEKNSFFDFAVAQSIFSHTGKDALENWLAGVSNLLKPTGALVATFLIGDQDPEQTGWIYPDCVTYKLSTMESCAQKYQLTFQVLDWRHPRQTWALFAMPDFDTSWLESHPLSWNTFLDHCPSGSEPQ